MHALLFDKHPGRAAGVVFPFVEGDVGPRIGRKPPGVLVAPLAGEELRLVGLQPMRLLARHLAAPAADAAGRVDEGGDGHGGWGRMNDEG